MPAAPSRLSRGGRRRLDELPQRGMRLGLGTISELLRRLFPRGIAVPRVLVGGTNGKGSVAATLSSILRASGVRAGLHTSPHLTDVTERVRVVEEDVLPGELDVALDRVFAAADHSPSIAPTYFETITAAAEVVFEAEKCRFAVVEVGLGGRLDATNAIDPCLSIVTSIGLDHVAELGETAEAIAREKAGIFRPDRPVICGRVTAAVRRVLAEEAGRAGAPIVFADDQVRILSREETVDGQVVRLETPRTSHTLSTPLRGEHQAENLALAVLAAENLSERLPEILPESISRGVSATRWPGRLEKVRLGPRTLWLDGCHNADGAVRLAGFLSGRPSRVDLIFGAMADKDIEGIARELFGCAGRIVLTVPSNDRAASIDDLTRRLAHLGRRLEIGATPGEALDLLAGPGPDILAAGSLFLIGEIRSIVTPSGRAA